MRRRKKIQNKSESESDTCNVSMLAKNVQVANSSDSQAVGGDIK